ncbi:MAG: peptide ABC transporter substrate-binding protein [Patescibacteria group bacterium]
MSSIKNKIKSFWQKVRLAWPFFSFFKKKLIIEDDLDKKLVYDLSSQKIPTRQQIKYLRKFLNPREFLIVKICALVILLNVVYLGFVIIKNHLQYSPASGGEYSEGVVGYPQTINPLYAVNHDIDEDLSRLIYSSLFAYDDNGHLSSDLADNVNVNTSGTEYIIKIKNGVKWHNGEELTVDDILFTFNRIQNPDYHSPLRLALVGVVAEKIDSATIKFILTEPYAPFLELLTFGILPKSLWENIGPKAAALSDLNLRPIGSGPFKFKSLIKNSGGDLKDYYLINNDNYYSKIPYLHTIDFKFFPSYQEAIKALNDNQIIGLSYLPFNLRSDLLAQNSLKFHELIQSQIVALFFNYNKNKNLSDKTVRVALATALDKKQIIKEVFSGIYQSVDSPILPGNFAYNEAVTRYNYAPEVAAETIKSKPLSTTLTVIDSGNNVAVAEKIKNYWEKIGVKIALKIVSGEQAADVIKNRDFEILLYGESVGGDPDVYAFWSSSQAGSGGLNLAGYNNPAVDKLLIEARTTTNLSERLNKYKKFQEIIADDLPAIFLYSPTYTYVQGSGLSGFSGTAIIEPADRFSGISSWYLNTKKKLIW